MIPAHHFKDRMSNYDSPFVVQQLRPSNPTGQSTATYQLTKASVSPARVLGRDAAGFPVEDTIPTVYWRWFLMADGCYNKVPLRTGSVFSMHADAVAYENETVHDLITSGAIPGWLCPYSTNYSHITNGPFAAPPPGVEDCGGSEKEGGCSHLKAISKARRDMVAANAQRSQDQFAADHAAKFDEMKREMAAMMVEGVGQAIAKHVSPQQQATAAKQRLRDGKGEE